ncbi:SWIM zinc finger family protein [Floccifex sp.]|uniref:SWIM zinc finger family protein n=1 Tax=Floccifex sp. TaxID=2815810 RepID=UPI003F00E6C0
MEWEYLFTNRILDRGWDYYNENAVEDLVVTNQEISATVMGNEDYEVNILIEDDEIIDMYCSCPYAAKGNNCKHMAAVLFAYSEKEEEIEQDILLKPVSLIEEEIKKRNEIDQLIKNADEEDVYSFLSSVLLNDEQLLLRFYNKVKKPDNKQIINEYIRQIDVITKRYAGRDHFIDYYHADDFISELEDMINNDIFQMISNENYLGAFEVVNYIFLLICSAEMDDSAGGTTILSEQIYEVWRELIERANPVEKEKMFNWFFNHVEDSDYIERIIIYGFEEKEYEQRKLDFVKNKIEDCDYIQNEWTRKYRIQKWIEYYLELLKNPDEINEVCETYWQYSFIRKYYIDICMKNQEYDRVLGVLDKSIVLDQENRGLIVDYNVMKKDIYLLQGKKDLYIEQLWKLVLEYKQGDMEIYRELKEQYTTDQWLIKREEIIQKLSTTSYLDEIYAEEKMYDQLLECVLNSSGLHVLQLYEDILVKKYPEQIINKYKEEVNRMAIYANKRKDYAYLVSLLRNMQQIEGSSQIVKDIVSEWKILYKKRPAMMDELKRI